MARILCNERPTSVQEKANQSCLRIASCSSVGSGGALQLLRALMLSNRLPHCNACLSETHASPSRLNGSWPLRNRLRSTQMSTQNPDRAADAPLLWSGPVGMLVHSWFLGQAEWPAVVKLALLTPRNSATSMVYRADRRRTRAPINSAVPRRRDHCRHPERRGLPFNPLTLKLRCSATKSAYVTVTRSIMHLPPM